MSYCHWWDYMHPSSPAREDVAFSNLDIQKVIKLLFSENFCLEEKCSLLGWLSFITQMAEQMSRGHPQLASKCIKRGAVGRGGTGKRQEENRHRLETHQSCQGRLCLARPASGTRGTRTSSRSSALPRLQACCPELFLERQVWVWLKGPSATGTWSALCGSCLLGVL